MTFTLHNEAPNRPMLALSFNEPIEPNRVAFYLDEDQLLTALTFLRL
jgi:hypothetical protein